MKKKEKISAGIICVRNNSEILMIRKRNTYAFVDFAFGNYSNNDGSIMKLLNNMTPLEKLIILSNNFQYIWYHVWANAVIDKSYYGAKYKFDSTFLVDNGMRLRRLITNSVNGKLIWEPPKGRKKNRSESDIQCAVREFTEETGISKKNYRIIPQKNIKCSFVDNNVMYTNIYIVAIISPSNSDVKLSFKNLDQVREVDDIQWLNINQIKKIDTHGHLIQLSHSALKIARSVI